MASSSKAFTAATATDETADAVTQEVELGFGGKSIDSVKFESVLDDFYFYYESFADHDMIIYVIDYRARLSEIFGREVAEKVGDRLISDLINRTKKRRRENSDKEEEKEVAIPQEQGQGEIDNEWREETCAASYRFPLKKEPLRGEAKQEPLNNQCCILEIEENEEKEEPITQENGREEIDNEWSEETCTPSYRFQLRKGPLREEAKQDSLTNQSCVEGIEEKEAKEEPNPQEIGREKIDNERSEETCTPSYRFLLKKDPLLEEAKKEPLNRQCRIVPPPPMDEARPPPSVQPSKCEEVLFKIENDKFELEMFLHRIQSAAEYARELLGKIEGKIPKQDAATKGFEGTDLAAFENYRKTRFHRSIEVLYGKHALEIKKELKSKPRLALPVLISRFEQTEKKCNKLLKIIGDPKVVLS